MSPPPDVLFDESDLAANEVLVFVPYRPELGATVCTLLKRSPRGVRVQWPDKSAGTRWAQPGPVRTFDLDSGVETSAHATLCLTAASLRRAQVWAK